VSVVQLGNSIVLWSRRCMLWRLGDGDSVRPIWCNAVREQCWWGLTVLVFYFAPLHWCRLCTEWFQSKMCSR